MLDGRYRRLRSDGIHAAFTRHGAHEKRVAAGRCRRLPAGTFRHKTNVRGVTRRIVLAAWPDDGFTSARESIEYLADLDPIPHRERRAIRPAVGGCSFFRGTHPRARCDLCRRVLARQIVLDDQAASAR